MCASPSASDIAKTLPPPLPVSYDALLLSPSSIIVEAGLGQKADTKFAAICRNEDLLSSTAIFSPRLFDW
jgi:hypothetical protein